MKGWIDWEIVRTFAFFKLICSGEIEYKSTAFLPELQLHPLASAPFRPISKATPIVESITDPKAIAQWSATCRRNNNSIGLVPTMGALHAGHLALIKRAKELTDRVICSIFVNPLQFNDRRDLEHYPRRLEEDIRLLQEEGCDALFIPVADTLFDRFKPIDHDLGGLDRSWEGASRPGHFQGVVNVVERLFFYTRPDMAFFGEKDRQQLTILQYVTEAHRWPIRIVPCPTHREMNGLAMSSRNLRLSATEREQAGVLYRSLRLAEQLARSVPLNTLESKVKELVEAEPGVELDHFGLADPATLRPIDDLTGIHSAIAFIAARVGPVRLIDNVVLNFKPVHQQDAS